MTVGAYPSLTGLARLHALMRRHTPPRQGTPMHARMHRPRSDIYYFSNATIIRERASVSRYTYIAPRVKI